MFTYSVSFSLDLFLRRLSLRFFFQIILLLLFLPSPESLWIAELFSADFVILDLSCLYSSCDVDDVAFPWKPVHAFRNRSLRFHGNARARKRASESYHVLKLRALLTDMKQSF